MELPEQYVVPLEQIEPHERNYKKHPHTQVVNIAGSLELFQQRKPIVVKKTTGQYPYKIVAGEGTYYAFQYLKQKYPDKETWHTIWIAIAPDDWTEEMAVGYLIADNETARGAETDNELLADMLREQLEAGRDLHALGVSQQEYSSLLGTIEHVEDIKARDGGVIEELDSFVYGTIRQIVLLFDVETYAQVLNNLQAIRTYYNLEANADVVQFLIDYYNRTNNEGAEVSATTTAQG